MAWVYLGSPAGLSATAAWTGEPDQPSANYGFTVASAGDVNGDGYDDVAVGAFTADNGQSDEGRAWVCHGECSTRGVLATAARARRPGSARSARC